MENHLKIIDLDLGKELVAGDTEMAKELLLMLKNNLPLHQSILQQALEQNDLSTLFKEAHKLHGATCYTGTPRLKQAAQNLEIAAKENKVDNLLSLANQLNTEIANFNQAFMELASK